MDPAKRTTQSENLRLRVFSTSKTTTLLFTCSFEDPSSSFIKFPATQSSREIYCCKTMYPIVQRAPDMETQRRATDRQNHVSTTSDASPKDLASLYPEDIKLRNNPRQLVAGLYQVILVIYSLCYSHCCTITRYFSISKGFPLIISNPRSEPHMLYSSSAWQLYLPCCFQTSTGLSRFPEYLLQRHLRHNALKMKLSVSQHILPSQPLISRSFKPFILVF